MGLGAPDQPVWVCFATILHQAFCTAPGLSMMSVGPFLLLNQPLWRTLDQKELFNRLHGSVCADHGMRYTGWQLRVELASSTAALHESERVTAHPPTEPYQVQGN